MSPEPAWIIVALIVLGAGVLKGSIGFGAPLTAVPLIAPFLGTRTAIILMAVPMLVANGGLLLTRAAERDVIRRFLPLLATLVPLTVVGGLLLARVDVRLLTVIVGVITLGFVGVTFAGLHPFVPPRLEMPVSLIIGAVAGVLSGATSVPGPIFALYLTGLRLDKRTFVYGITLLLAVGNVVQVATYAQQRLLAGDALLGSLALVPAMLLGQQIGLRIQDRLDPVAFRRVVLVVVALAGLNLLARGLGVL